MSDPNATADALATIADLVRHGLPVPIAIRPRDSDRVTVQPKAADLGDWLVSLEVAWPQWDVTGEYAHARWPDGTFGNKSFALEACRKVEQA
jgi:hypothetical protein